MPRPDGALVPGGLSRAAPRAAGAGILGLAIWVVVAACEASSVPAQQSLDIARVNEALRSLDAVDIDGNEWSFRTLRGRVVLIDFWATWCAPCLAEIPYQHELVERYPDDFLLLGVSLDRASRRDVVRWLNRQRVSWPQVHDGRGYGGELARAFGVEQLPTSVLVDHEGRVRAFDRRGDALLQAVRVLVEELRGDVKAGG